MVIGYIGFEDFNLIDYLEYFFKFILKILYIMMKDISGWIFLILFF